MAERKTFGGHYINGVLYPGFISAEKLEELTKANVVRSSDVFVLTHPKCGTTLTQQMISLLLNDGEQGDKNMMQVVPWLERDFGVGEASIEGLSTGTEQRYFKSHADPSLFPGDWRVPKGTVTNFEHRLLFVSRNPKDVAVSLFHHMRAKNAWKFDEDWESYFELLLKGEVENSSWARWHREWWRRHKENETASSLWLQYEEIIKDLPAAIEKIAKFIGVKASPELIKKVAQGSTLDAMKKNPKANCSWIPERDGEQKHLRKGGKGGWRKQFTDEQNKRFDEHFAEEIGDCDIPIDYGA